MALETTPARSRRALLAAALGGAGATLVQAIARPLRVKAAGDDGTNIAIAGLYADAQGQTTLGNRANNNRVLWVASNPDDGNGEGVAITGYSAKSKGVEGFSNSGIGVYGHSTSSTGVFGDSSSSRGVEGHSVSDFGVYGLGDSKPGVYGTSASGAGVEGHSTSGMGVFGESDSATKPATVGQSSGSSTGLLGHSGPGDLPAAPAKTAVYGHAVQDASSRGVWGRSNSGRGVYGQATTGSGLYGTATTGFALRTSGRVRAEKVSGVASIPAGATSVTVSPGVDITSGSFVLLSPKPTWGDATCGSRPTPRPTRSRSG
jgi:hypothetical protein